MTNMVIGKILNSFVTRDGEVYILDLGDYEYRPSMGWQVFFNNVLLNIKPYGMGYHEYYKDGFIISDNAWSCTFENANDKKPIPKIPIGTRLVIYKPSKA